MLAQPKPAPAAEIDLTSAPARANLAKLSLRLFDLWQLDTSTQLQLLGLSPTSRALLTRYRNGAAVPNNRDGLDRIGWLLAIHKALRLLYPYNDTLCYGWVKLRHSAFGQRTALEVMVEDGLIGLAKVARYLDWQRGR